MKTYENRGPRDGFTTETYRNQVDIWEVLESQEWAFWHHSEEGAFTVQNGITIGWFQIRDSHPSTLRVNIWGPGLVREWAMD